MSRIVRAAIGATMLLALLAGCERTHVQQIGYRGTAMNILYSPDTLAAQQAVNKQPKPLRTVSADGPTAGQEYQNVQVLTDLSKAEFARMMISIKNWVAPDIGCDFCHAAPDYASDAKYTKVMARAMLRMTRHINSDWKQHVKATGVTCYTCHRGQPVPPKVWFSIPQIEPGMMVRKSLVRLPTPSAARTTLADPLTNYLLHDDKIRVVSLAALPEANNRTMSNTRLTNSLMILMSESLGVNCNYCHNSRAFYKWDESVPPRATAWYGIRMVRDLNNTVLVPLSGILPKNRMGPGGDGPKVYCATCHLGTFKPFAGVSQIAAFPALVGTKAEVAAQAAEAAAAAAAASPVPAAAAPAPGPTAAAPTAAQVKQPKS
jgi:photosynthetic reaction center cytochrome c subunit